MAPAPPPAWSGRFPPERVLVIELWGIGDVVLATSALAELRDRFPAARVTLLAKAPARTVLEHSGLVDEVIAVDFPWTAFNGKYLPWRYDLPALAALFRELRARRFDVSLDARRDIRSNLVAYLSGAARRVGFDFGGGTRYLTDVVPSGAQNAHKIEDWMQILEPLVGELPSPRPRVLRVTEAEKLAASRTLLGLGLDPGRAIVAIHAGANHPVRRVREELVREVAHGLVREHGAQVVLSVDREGYGSSFQLPPEVRIVRPGLRELMGLLTQVDLLVCSDSGPMHIAAALGTPVAALHGSAPPEWYGPREPEHRVVHIARMPCRPCFDACIHSSPICMDAITTGMVLDTVAPQLESARLRRAPHQAQS